jgi:hypothetical protein
MIDGLYAKISIFCRGEQFQVATGFNHECDGLMVEVEF